MSNVHPLVSIIIPVYKVEKYLDECVESVRNQTYNNLEIILVDDGSPDRCGQMCEKYAAEDTRIRVIHQENRGVAKARNNGLSIASGEYLFFADSDDVVGKHAIEQMLTTALEYSADMVCSVHSSIDEDGKALGNDPAERELLCMNTKQALHYYTQSEWGPWNRLIRTDVHRGIDFPNYRIHEDEAIKFLLLERCGKVVQVFSPTYYYRQRKSSATSAESSVDRMDMFYSRRENLNYLRQNHPDLAPLFLPKVCEDALLNLGLRTGCVHRKADGKVLELVSFFQENNKEIQACPHTTKAQKVRSFLIVRSDWRKTNNMYIRFYAFLNRLRGRS